MLARIRLRRPMLHVAAAVLTAGVMVLSPACDKVPLTAPNGTVITLFPSSNTVPLNGEIEIVATAIESGTTETSTTTTVPGSSTTSTTTTTPGLTATPTTPTALTRLASTSTAGAGTPVQNGTVITFTTTVGRIEPAEARTENGQVRVKLIAGSESGVATITAFSGGSSGKLENVRIGSAAVERVTVTANPTTLPATGGSTELSAFAEDTNGAPVVGVPVTFSASQGSLSANPVNTNSNGIAKTTLTTTRESSVNASVGGKSMSSALTISLAARTGVAISVTTTGTISAGTAVSFTVSVTTPSSTTTPLQDVRVNYGDGSGLSLGAISGSVPISHPYQTEGTYIVSATATDVTGFSETVSTSVTVSPAQPPGVTLSLASSAVVNQAVTITATVSGATSTITGYTWDLDEGSVPESPRTTTGNQITVRWTSDGPKIISVTVTQANGPSANGFGSITISASTSSVRDKP